jgi:hypothetical protein
MTDFATGARHGVSYVAESVKGTTPATPAMTTLRLTGISLELSQEGFQSSELRGDRQIHDYRHGTRQVEGQLDFELSYGAYDDLLEGALFGSWSTAGQPVLKAGSEVKSFTIERRFLGLDTPQYLSYTGCMINQLSLSVRPEGIVSGSMGIIGLGAAAQATTLGEPSDPAANSPFDAFHGVIKEGASLATLGVVTALELSLNNGISAAFAIGGVDARDAIEGRSDLTGSLSAYFQDTTLLAKFLNESESALELILEDLADSGEGNKYQISIPRLKFTGGQMPVRDEGPVVITLPFQVLYDSTEETNLKITRIDAA